MRTVKTAHKISGRTLGAKGTRVTPKTQIPAFRPVNCRFLSSAPTLHCVPFSLLARPLSQCGPGPSQHPGDGVGWAIKQTRRHRMRPKDDQGASDRREPGRKSFLRPGPRTQRGLGTSQQPGNGVGWAAKQTRRNRMRPKDDQEASDRREPGRKSFLRPGPHTQRGLGTSQQPGDGVGLGRRADVDRYRGGVGGRRRGVIPFTLLYIWRRCGRTCTSKSEKEG